MSAPSLGTRSFPGRGLLLRLFRLLAVEVARIQSRACRSDIAVFHEFAPPPAGGGHQFLRALIRELERRGWCVSVNTMGPLTKACLFNSFNFDPWRLRRLRRKGCRMVHRVDGPIGVYRGSDDGTDARICQLNARFADATILQSTFSSEKHAELGFKYADPSMVINAPDGDIFYGQARKPYGRGEPLRIIAASWSDNPNKGADVYQWLDAHLDPTRYAFTFVGRIKGDLPRTTQLPPVASEALADLFRSHDIYVTASKDDPCSNTLLEALACGLPALYRQSGGHPELVGPAGVGFDGPADVLSALDQLSESRERCRDAIRVPTIHDVADRYLEVMGLPSVPEGSSHGVT